MCGVKLSFIIGDLNASCRLKMLKIVEDFVKVANSFNSPR